MFSHLKDEQEDESLQGSVKRGFTELNIEN